MRRARFWDSLVKRCCRSAARCQFDENIVQCLITALECEKYAAEERRK